MSTTDPPPAFVSKALRPLQGFSKAIVAGNAKTLAGISRFKHWIAGGTAGMAHALTAKLHVNIGHRSQRRVARHVKAHFVPPNTLVYNRPRIVPAAPPALNFALVPQTHGVIEQQSTHFIAALRHGGSALPVNEAPVAQLALSAPRTSLHRSASYLNYDVFAAPEIAYGIFGYGTRVGSGVAQVNLLARALGENRGIMLSGLAWQRHSDVTGSTLTIGDAESIRGKYEESVRFDGVQYSGRNVSYAVGWERTDFGDSAMHFGTFMTQVTASKLLTRRLTGEAHLFADSTTALIGIGGIWTTPTMGQLQLGLAPARGRGITGYFGYAYTSPRLRFSLEDRVWGAQSFDIGQLAPANYRQLRATLDYNVSHTSSIRLGYGTQTQGVLPMRTMTLGLIQRVDGSELHVDLASSSSGTMRNAGLATYLSLPLGNGRSVTEQSSLQGGTSSSNVVYKQDVPSSGVGTGYALSFGRNGASFTDAAVTSQTLGSTTRFDLSHVGSTLNWNSEFSGSVLFFGGKAYAANQVIDQSAAADVLKGHGEATVTIVSETGRALPAGSIVRVLGESGEWRVDEDGRVDIDDMPTGPETLIVTLPKGTCVIGIVMPPNVESGSYDLGKQLCLRY